MIVEGVDASDVHRRLSLASSALLTVLGRNSLVFASPFQFDALCLSHVALSPRLLGQGARLLIDSWAELGWLLLRLGPSLSQLSFMRLLVLVQLKKLQVDLGDILLCKAKTPSFEDSQPSHGHRFHV